MKHTYICSTCEGSDLVYDATVLWNPIKQEFEIGDIYEGPPYCRDCETEVRDKEVDFIPPTD